MGGDTIHPYTVFEHSISDTATPANENCGHSFRVVRRNAGIAMLRVFSKDEGIAEANISKPRIYVENSSSVKLSNFTVHYYFTTENGKAPVLDQYWVPEANLSLHQLNDSLWEIRYFYTSELDTGGTILPVLDGNVVGIHYTDYGTWDKTNDYSFNNSSIFLLNDKITITDSAGFIISGEYPQLPSVVPDTGSGKPIIICVFKR